jgi:hypothetical protein
LRGLDRLFMTGSVNHMPRYMLLLLLFASSLHGGAIRGVVVEDCTSRPLARASVRLEALDDKRGGIIAMRADRHGEFAFSSLPAGKYLLRAERNGFLPFEYGQKRWNSAVTPIDLKSDANLFMELHLLRYSSISGAVIDEQGVGMPGAEVTALRGAAPPSIAARAVTDDRGAFRIFGLEPGSYFVRTGGVTNEDISYSPTLHRQAVHLEEATAVELQPEEQADHIEIRAVEGSLYRLEVTVTSSKPLSGRLTVTLASTLSRQVCGSIVCTFTNLPPGEYEAYAETSDGFGALQHVNLGADSRVGLSLEPTASGIAIDGGPPFNTTGELLVRRKDLAGVYPATHLPIKPMTLLAPGRYDAMVIPPDKRRVVFFFPGSATVSRDATHLHGWNEFAAGPNQSGRFVFEPGPGSVSGVVKRDDEPVPDAPVYLEPYEPTTAKRAGELRTLRTDEHGGFRFKNLTPGFYRVLSTFEYRDPDAATLDLAKAPQVSVSDHTETGMDLRLWVIR